MLGMAALVALILLRIPVGVALGLVGFVGYASVNGWSNAATVLGQVPIDVASNYTFSQIPLFILMGELAMHSGLSARLFDAARVAFSGVRGAQAYATLGACAAFGSVSGSSVATAATMTRIAIPEMRRAGYDDRLSTGSVAAGGSLGILIPPSIPLVIYAIIAEQSVTKLYAAALIPGLLLTALYMLCVLPVVALCPHWVPAEEARPSLLSRIKALISGWEIVLLIVFIIGGMLAGWFTANEAAAVGVVATAVLGRFAGDLSWSGVVASFVETVRTTCMLFVIVISAVVLTYFVVLTQLPALLTQWAQGLGLSPVGLIISMIVFYIVLGCFMEAFGMILITVPVFLPVIVQAGFDPLWFGIILVIVIELGLIHPPVGMNIFVMQAQLPDIPVITLYQGIVPFLAAPIVLLGLMIAYPSLANWLPSLLHPAR